MSAHSPLPSIVGRVAGAEFVRAYGVRMIAPGQNWAGNHRYGATVLHQPDSLDGLRRIVAAAQRLRALGSRHSFNDIADSAAMVTVACLPADVAIDRGAGTISFGAGMTYGQLAEVLRHEDLAVHNMASLPHISVGGAIATATHGSGNANGNLATAVRALEIVTSDGDVVTLALGDPDFEGAVVSLGALGVTSRVSLAAEPAYLVAQTVYVDMAWPALLDHFDDVVASGYSVSAFTRWSDRVPQVWVKSRVSDGEPTEVPEKLFGASAASVDLHPVAGVPSDNCTPQCNRVGLWCDRLPHFRMGFTPSAGEELQSEFFVPRFHAVTALDAVRALSGLIEPNLLVSEIRTVAADTLWMSPHYGMDSVAIHFTWKPDPAAVSLVLGRLEPALAVFGARPHWGKVFTADSSGIATSYERRDDFVRLVERLDPRGVFRNEWLERHIL